MVSLVVLHKPVALLLPSCCLPVAFLSQKRIPAALLSLSCRSPVAFSCRFPVVSLSPLALSPSCRLPFAFLSLILSLCLASCCFPVVSLLPPCRRPVASLLPSCCTSPVAFLSPACCCLLLPCCFAAAFPLFSCRHPVVFLSPPCRLLVAPCRLSPSPASRGPNLFVRSFSLQGCPIWRSNFSASLFLVRTVTIFSKNLIFIPPSWWHSGTFQTDTRPFFGMPVATVGSVGITLAQAAPG